MRRNAHLDLSGGVYADEMQALSRDQRISRQVNALEAGLVSRNVAGAVTWNAGHIPILDGFRQQCGRRGKGLK